MDKYKEQFKIINDYFKEEIKQPKVDHCDNCNIQMYVSPDCYYVCKICGRCKGYDKLSTLIGDTYFNKELTYSKKTVYHRSEYLKQKLIKVPQMSNELIDHLVILFQKINNVYQVRQLQNKKNFIQYDYVIIKLLIHLNKNHLIKYFKMPLRKKTLKKYDSIWKIICDDLGIIFVSSIKKKQRRKYTKKKIKKQQTLTLFLNNIKPIKT
jgi:hypothetical protein